jgi:hypothetical protein
MEAASHVWLSIENDPDMYIPAQAVHRQGGHVTLLASRDTRNGSSEQRIVIPEARFRELPRADPTELHMLSQPNFALNDAALLTTPSEPALLHLLRRRFNTGRRCTAVGPWLIVLGDPSVYDEAPGEEEVHATSRKNAGLYLNEAEPSMAELAARVHIRMLTLRRPQAVVLLGGAAGGAADATTELLRFLRRVQDARCNAHGSRLAARAEAAVGVLLVRVRVRALTLTLTVTVTLTLTKLRILRRRTTSSSVAAWRSSPPWSSSRLSPRALSWRLFTLSSARCLTKASTLQSCLVFWKLMWCTGCWVTTQNLFRS